MPTPDRKEAIVEKSQRPGVESFVPTTKIESNEDPYSFSADLEKLTHAGLIELKTIAKAAKQSAENIEAFLTGNLPENLHYDASAVPLGSEDVTKLQTLVENVAAIAESEAFSPKEVAALGQTIESDPHLLALVAPLVTSQDEEMKNLQLTSDESLNRIVHLIITAANPQKVQDLLAEGGTLRNLIQRIEPEEKMTADVSESKVSLKQVRGVFAKIFPTLAVVAGACTPTGAPDPTEATRAATQPPTATIEEPTATQEEPSSEPTSVYFDAGGNELQFEQLSPERQENIRKKVDELKKQGVAAGLFDPEQVQIKVYIQDPKDEESDYRVALESTDTSDETYPAGTVFVRQNEFKTLQPLALPEGQTPEFSFDYDRWVGINKEGQVASLLANNGYTVPNPQHLDRFQETSKHKKAFIFELATQGVNWSTEEVIPVETTADGQILFLAVDPRSESALGRGVWGIWRGEFKKLTDLPADYDPNKYRVQADVFKNELELSVLEAQKSTIDPKNEELLAGSEKISIVGEEGEFNLVDPEQGQLIEGFGKTASDLGWKQTAEGDWVIFDRSLNIAIITKEKSELERLEISPTLKERKGDIDYLLGYGFYLGYEVREMPLNPNNPESEKADFTVCRVYIPQEEKNDFIYEASILGNPSDSRSEFLYILEFRTPHPTDDWAGVFQLQEGLNLLSPGDTVRTDGPFTPSYLEYAEGKSWVDKGEYYRQYQNMVHEYQVSQPYLQQQAWEKFMNNEGGTIYSGLIFEIDHFPVESFLTAE